MEYYCMPNNFKLSIKGFGWREFIIALLPIIGPYQYGPIFLSYIICAIFSVVALTKQRLIISDTKPLILLLILFIFHELIYIPILDFDSSRINNDLSILLYLVSIILITPLINYEKLEKALLFIAVVCCGGMVYSFIELVVTGYTTPITIPFLPAPNSTSRLFEEFSRPTSFFFEPAAYVGYMIVPMFIAIHKQKLALFAVFMLSMFLSTSTTGIIVSIVMVVVYLLKQKGNIFTKIFLLVLSIIAIVLLNTSDLFEIGASKIANTDVTTNARLANGFILISKLNIPELLFGMPYANATAFTQQTGIMFIENRSYDIFIPTFWNLLACYGVFFLIAYLAIYYKIIRKYKDILPFMIPIIITMFSDPTSMSVMYVFQLLFMYPFVNYYKKQYEGLYTHNPICN